MKGVVWCAFPTEGEEVTVEMAIPPNGVEIPPNGVEIQATSTLKKSCS